MSRSITVVAIGDIQICPKSYKDTDYFLNTLVMDQVRAVAADVVVLPGDLFEYSTYTNNHIPASTIIEPVTRFIEALACYIPKNSFYQRSSTVLIVDGNHDKTYGSFANANDIIKGSHVRHCSNTIEKLGVGCVDFILVPWLMPHEYLSKIDVLDYIRSLADKSKEDGRLPFLVAHLTAIGSESNSHEIKPSDYSFCFSKEEIGSLGIEWGVLGDIHKAQTVVNNIDYMGSIKQRNFGEAGNLSLIRTYEIVSPTEITFDDIDVTDLLPRYHILSFKDQETLTKALQTTEFLDRDKYRLDLPFEPLTRIKASNIFYKIDLPKKTKTALDLGKSIKTDPVSLLSLYNTQTKEFSPVDMSKVISFFKEFHRD